MTRKHIIITGGSSGLGAAIQLAIASWWSEYDIGGTPQPVIHNWSLDTGVDVSNPASVYTASCDLINHDVEADEGIDVLINCAGVNYIDWHESTPIEEWDRLMNTNARSMWLVTKQLINDNIFSDPGTIVNIVSNASHIPMTNSSAYNASKGAAHILTLQMARELRKRHNLTVFGISPNKMHSTHMSEYIEGRVCNLRGWTPEEAREYQAAALPAGVETDPKACAEFIAFLLSSRERHRYLHGTVIPYGA